MNIPFFTLEHQRKQVDSKIKKKLSKIVDSGYYVDGPESELLEEKICKTYKCKYAVPCNSGTMALQLLGLYMKLQNNNILTQPNSFIATASAFSSLGKEIYFADTEKYGQISLEGIKHSAEHILSEGDAVVSVCLYGYYPELDKIQKLCKEKKFYHIIDACQAHLAEFKGKPVLDYADASAISFYVSKQLCTYGEGGAVLTNNEEIYKVCKSLRNHGRGETKYEHQYIGLNGRLSEFQCGVLNVNIDFLPKWVEERRKIASVYNKYLSKFEIIPPNNDCSYYVYPIWIDNRDEIQLKLKEKGIGTAVFYPKLIPLQPCYSGLNYHDIDFPNAFEQCNRQLCLPLFLGMTKKEIEYVCEILKNL